MPGRRETPSKASATAGGGGGAGPCWGRGQMFGTLGNLTANRQRSGPLGASANVTVQGQWPALDKCLHRD